MARCQSCSAPLPTQNPHCRYCGVRNDLDLHALDVEPVEKAGDPWTCPECSVALEPLSVNLGSALMFERCGSCFGMFFTPGGVDYALDQGVSQVHRVKLDQIDQINQDRFRAVSVRYRSCPVCQGPMRRYNFGHRSGVIVDQCPKHGIWLDNGELIHLLEWRKSGGHLIGAKLGQQIDGGFNAARTENAKKAAKLLGRRSGSGDSVLNMQVDDLVYGAVDLLTGLFK